jgi:hypothetical protein
MRECDDRHEHRAWGLRAESGLADVGCAVDEQPGRPLDLTQEGGARDVHRAGRLRNGLLPEPHREVTQFRRQGGQHPVEIEGQIGTLRAARPVTVGDVGGRLVPGEPGVQRPDADLQPLDRQPVASDEQFGAGGTATC